MQDSHPLDQCILIVDDNPVNVKLLEHFLKSRGYRTLSAYNGQEGRGLAKEKRPDLILLDIMMPGENGFDTCILLKRDPATNDIPVIFLSGMNDENSQEKGLKLGAVDYIAKPFKEEEVIGRTVFHLSQRRLRAVSARKTDFRLRHLQSAHQAFMIQANDIPEANFGVSYLPIVSAGNDFYDIVPVNDDSWMFFVADVSIHDIQGAFLSFALKALLNRSTAQLQNPFDRMLLISKILLPHLRAGEFFNACLALLDRAHSKLTIANAGKLPFIYHHKGNVAVLMGGDGEAIGLNQSPKVELIEQTVKKGDRFFLLSDGLLEPLDEAGNSKENKLRDLLQYCVDAECLSIDMAPSEITNTIKLSAPAPQDDILLMGVEI